MTRSQLILDTLNDAFRAVDEFDVLLTWHAGDVRSTERDQLYIYHLDETNLLDEFYEDMSAPHPAAMKTRLGIKFSFSVQSDTENAPLTERFGNIKARIEYVLRSLDLPVTATDDYGLTTKITAAVLENTFGLFDDGANDGDSAGIIAVYSMNTA